jgi:hypothetical protein
MYFQMYPKRKDLSGDATRRAAPRREPNGGAPPTRAGFNLPATL